MRDPTLKDVAARAGVSTATVSRVLHGNGYVSERSRELVQAALDESGYRLNAVAQELRTQRTIALGLIVQGLENPYFAEVAAGVERAAAERDFNVLLFNARGDADTERKHVETLLRRRVDGIIFTPALAGDTVALAANARVSVVELGRRLYDGAPAILLDEHGAARDAVRHLTDLGHREIGYLGEPWGYRKESPDDTLHGGSPKARFSGYREGLSTAGIAIDERLVVLGEYRREPGGWGSVQTGAEYMARLLDQAPGMTAVFAASDILASGALQTLYRRGVRVPEDVSMVGFDDTFAAHLAPPLTSMGHEVFEMGYRAGVMAIEQLADGHEQAPTLPCRRRFVVRESTAAPRAAA